jgi:hypothetical protein
VKLTAQNAGELILTSHCNAVASASLAPPPPQSAASQPLPVSEPSGLAAPMDLDVESSPVPVPSHPSQASTKRPGARPTIDSDANTTNVEDTPKMKKPKTTSGQGLYADVSIISIDDVDDPQDELVNKTDPSADIREFFITLPLAPGQEKRRVRCKLCA